MHNTIPHPSEKIAEPDGRITRVWWAALDHMVRSFRVVEGGYATLESPVFTGNPEAPTPMGNDNDTSIATTAFVQTELSDYVLTTTLASYATLASPTFTGDPKAPTPAAADNDTSIATTAYVQTELANYALLASPALTGNPTAPTPAAADNDTSIATTAYVQTELADYAPLTDPVFTNGVVTNNAALATTDTDGFLYIPTCAGPPTGVPTAQTGTVAMVYDTTNNKLYIYNGGWKGGTGPGVWS